MWLLEIAAAIAETFGWFPFLFLVKCPACSGRLDTLHKPNPNKHYRCVHCGKIWAKTGKHWQQVEKEI